MKTFVVLCCIFASAFAMDACACNRMYLPVCGSDGKTYSNPCMLNCERASHNPDLKFVSYGFCHNIVTAIKPNDDACVCNRMYLPVCGSDGITYSNPCMLNCERASQNPDLKFVSYGFCHNIVTAIKPNDDACVCNRMYLPVCGSDGITYSNPCMLNCERASHNPDLKFVSYGFCHNIVTAIKPNDDACVCNRMYLPVCGSDGITYSNPCMLNCERASHNPDLKLVSYGFCHNIVTAIKPNDDFDCICTFEYAPVCGSNGHTYGNICEFNCAKKHQPSLSLVGHGQCEQINAAIQSDNDLCICTLEYAPVCGSDGRTYGNLCEFNCAKKHQPSLSLIGHGQCEEINAVAQSDDFCICTREYMPVCGSNGVTYGNLCEMKCAQKKNPDLTIVGMDECENLKNMKNEDSCICTMEYLPVCGSDGQTYSNLCYLHCSQSQNPDLVIAHEGICRQVILALTPACKCNKMSRPVCGSDGVTYSNPCLLNCAKKTNMGLKMVKEGSCSNIFAQAKEIDTCSCTKEFEPVCGNDLKTYGNMCLFNCAASKKQGLKLLYKMVCMIV